MNVTLVQYGDIYHLIMAIRICHDSIENSDSLNGHWIGEKDKKLISNIIKKGHESTLEHMSYMFYIDGISRGCLQELVRHRIASYSVQSTRYTLKKQLKEENENFIDKNNYNRSVLEKYCILTGDVNIDYTIACQMQKLKSLIDSNILTNDIIKYAIPEAFKTKLYITINARSLRNFLQLRLDKSAHWEIQSLARNIIAEIPEGHKILFEDLLRSL